MIIRRKYGGLELILQEVGRSVVKACELCDYFHNSYYFGVIGNAITTDEGLSPWSSN